jgi:acyl-CoA hydrolase
MLPTKPFWPFEVAVQTRITLRFLAEPQHVNFGGKVHGGQVMKWIDQAGYACAAGYSGRYCVTAYVGGIHFNAPIRIGDVVSVEARLLLTGKTSMHIGVEVRARDPKDSESRSATDCVLVFVALDEKLAPVAVPPFVPDSDVDRALHDYARELKQLEASALAQRQALMAKLRVIRDA